MGALSPTHWLIIIGVLVLLFGAKRLPDAARSLGRSARILKAEVRDINPDNIHPTSPDRASAAATTDTAATTHRTLPVTAMPDPATTPRRAAGDPAAGDPVTGEPAAAVNADQAR